MYVPLEKLTKTAKYWKILWLSMIQSDFVSCMPREEATDPNANW